MKFLTLQPETAKKVSKASNRFWLAGITIGLLNGSLKVGHFETIDYEQGSVYIRSLHVCPNSPKSSAHNKKITWERRLNPKQSFETLKRLFTHPQCMTLLSHTENRDRSAARHQLTMDSLDVWIPATALELTSFSDGVLGLAG